jgi:adenylylsulfate kinase-like enzyme
MANVYWITGFSGAGKTTISIRLANMLRAQGKIIFLLDGDAMREILPFETGHAPQERKKIAYFYSHLCKSLSDQGITVVCATISMFHEVRSWNRSNINDYTEVYLKVPPETLIERDPKNIYKKLKLGEASDVVGFDLPGEEPENPDIILEPRNNEPPDELTQRLYEQLSSLEVA